MKGQSFSCRSYGTKQRVSRDTFDLFMKEQSLVVSFVSTKQDQHIQTVHEIQSLAVTIASMKQQKRVTSEHTYSLIMKR